MMDSLLMSRIKKDASPSKLKNLSPQKYGKAAWADLSFTPCKLADNIMFREAATLRKNEEGSNRLRQFEAMNGFMKQRLNQLEEERDGIQLSLNQQIGMYKKMYYDSEAKHESRLKDIQKRFSSEIAILISQKEEEAKFAQAEKEILQDRITELERRLKDTQERQSSLNSECGGLQGTKEKLQIEVQHLKDLIYRLETDRTCEQEAWKREKEELGRKIKSDEKQYQEKLEVLGAASRKEKDALERLMRTELQKLENTRMSEGLRKAQEMREIMLTFEKQTKRLNQIIEMKDRMLDSLSVENSKNKQSLLEITASYQSRINTLTHNRNDLAEQVEQSLLRISQLEGHLEEEIKMRAQDREHFGRTIVELKEELQRNEVTFVRERDRYQFWGVDLEKENVLLRTQNERAAQVFEENNKLSTELRKLRDLLMESSYQIERSKEELVRMSYERDSLAVRLEHAASEKERTLMIKRDLQEETASKWRSSYRAERLSYRH